MIRLVVQIAAVLAVATGRRSPNADRLESFIKSSDGSRFSNNILEDALLDAPGLITKYGYPVEIHKVVTSDGYILESHRIPYGREKNNRPGDKPVVFLMHGLLSSSADFVVLGPGNALAYLLAEEGYDVWLGNARGNFYSRNHTTLDPNDKRNQDFWKFSWEQIGLYDLPAFIDHILTTTGQKKLHYVGHSQGGTTFLVLNSLRPEYNEKFISFQGLAPASYFTYNVNSIYKSLAPFEKILETITVGAMQNILTTTGQKKLHYVGHSQGGTTFLVLNSLRPEYNEKFISFQGLAPASYFTYNVNSIYKSLTPFEKILETTAFNTGLAELLPDRESMATINSICTENALFQPICGGINIGDSATFDEFNSTMLPLFWGHAPAGASIRQLAHYGQCLRRNTFSRYYYDSLTNLRVYGRFTPPAFDVSLITVPSFLYYGLSDVEVYYRDLYILGRNLRNVVGLIQADRPSFNHFDFIWGSDIKAEVYDKLFESLRWAENH